KAFCSALHPFARGEAPTYIFDEELYALSLVAAIFVSPLVGGLHFLSVPTCRGACAVFFFVQPPTRRPNAKCCCICIFLVVVGELPLGAGRPWTTPRLSALRSTPSPAGKHRPIFLMRSCMRCPWLRPSLCRLSSAAFIS
ncbi:unnamed protein product, partial [Pylaiella littoralis]